MVNILLICYFTRNLYKKFQLKISTYKAVIAKNAFSSKLGKKWQKTEIFENDPQTHQLEHKAHYGIIKAY